MSCRAAYTTECYLATNQIYVEHAAQSVCFGASFELCLHDAVLLPGMAWHIALKQCKRLNEQFTETVFTPDSHAYHVTCLKQSTLFTIQVSFQTPSFRDEGVQTRRQLMEQREPTTYNVYDASPKVM